MKWSFQIGRFAGIDVYMHFTFLFLVGWVALTLAGSQKDFPVADNGRMEGVLTQTDLMKALSQREIHPTVASAAQNKIVTVDSHDMLETAFAKLQDCNCHTTHTFTRHPVFFINKQTAAI